MYHDSCLGMPSFAYSDKKIKYHKKKLQVASYMMKLQDIAQQQ
jgi:hypothetical protein